MLHDAATSQLPVWGKMTNDAMAWAAMIKMKYSLDLPIAAFQPTGSEGK